MKKVLILGGTGFLGYALAQALQERSSMVRVYSPSAEKINIQENIEPITGFIADFGNLQPHLAWADEIYHFVSSTNPKSSFADPGHDIASNLLPLIPILEFFKSYPEKYFVFCSSGGAVYGNSEAHRIDENHPKNPQSSYGIVKSTMEDYILYYQRLYGIEALILRPSNIYGLKKHDIGRQGLISTLVINTLHSKQTEIWVPLSTAKDYLYLDDFIAAVTSLVTKKATGIFNIASGKVFTIQEIIDKIEKVIGAQVSIKLLTQLHAKIDVPVKLSAEKIKNEVDWKPKIDLEKGIIELYNQLKQ